MSLRHLCGLTPQPTVRTKSWRPNWNIKPLTVQRDVPARDPQVGDMLLEHEDISRLERQIQVDYDRFLHFSKEQQVEASGRDGLEHALQATYDSRHAQELPHPAESCKTTWMPLLPRYVKGGVPLRQK